MQLLTRQSGENDHMIVAAQHKKGIVYMLLRWLYLVTDQHTPELS